MKNLVRCKSLLVFLFPFFPTTAPTTIQPPRLKSVMKGTNINSRILPTDEQKVSATIREAENLLDKQINQEIKIINLGVMRK